MSCASRCGDFGTVFLSTAWSPKCSSGNWVGSSRTKSSSKNSLPITHSAGFEKKTRTNIYHISKKLKNVNLWRKILWFFKKPDCGMHWHKLRFATCEACHKLRFFLGIKKLILWQANMISERNCRFSSNMKNKEIACLQ